MFFIRYPKDMAVSSRAFDDIIGAHMDVYIDSTILLKSQTS